MKKKLFYAIGGLVFIYGLLLIPNSNSINIATKGNSTPFIWNQDHRWNEMEDQFKLVRDNSEMIIEESVSVNILSMNEILSDLNEDSFSADDERLETLLNLFFETAPFIAAQEMQEPDFFEIYDETRRVMKSASINWDVDDLETRISL